MHSWGPWHLDEKNLQLVHKDGYEVSLPSCGHSAAILDWIFQVQSKTWGDAETLKGLLDALDAILMPQANYCSGGIDHRADGAALATQFLENPEASRELTGR